MLFYLGMQTHKSDKSIKKEAMKLTKSLNNWGRWGKKDELGTLNFITHEKIKKTVSLIKDGVAISCARTIETSSRPNMNLEVMRYIVDKNDVRAMEFVGMVFHGKAITHLDSPTHYFFEGKTYNNHIADGAKFCDAEVAKNGILTRGIFFDIKGKMVTASDLEVSEKRAGVRVESGDVLLVRTGVGFRADATKWFYDKQISVVGSDAPNDTPFFHHICLVQMGLWILDNCSLEELSKECKKRKRNEFLISINPLRLKNVTGSPVNPVVIF